MLYNNYEEYMRNVLGHSYTPGNTYEQFDNNYANCMNYNFANRNTSYTNPYNNSSNIEDMYPDLYRLINPLVCDMCDKNNKPITEDLVEQMTNHIYDNVVNRVEIQNVINLNIETRNSKTKENEKNIENRSPVPASRPRRNRLLQDLIRILLLNELLRRNRPPFRPGPGPMPMPPRPWF